MSQAAIRAKRETERALDSPPTLFGRAERAATRKTEQARNNAERWVAHVFGVQAEAYVGIDQRSERYPMWQRICVDILGYSLNYRASSEYGNKMQAYTFCPGCDLLITYVIGDLAELGHLVANPQEEQRWCSTCNKRQPVIWTKAKTQLAAVT